MLKDLERDLPKSKGIARLLLFLKSSIFPLHTRAFHYVHPPARAYRHPEISSP